MTDPTVREEILRRLRNTEFERLLTMFTEEPEVLAAVRDLLHQKRRSPELGRAARVDLLNQFIEAELDLPPAQAPKKSGSPEVIGALNGIFHEMLAEYGAATPMHATGGAARA